MQEPDHPLEHPLFDVGIAAAFCRLSRKIICRPVGAWPMIGESASRGSGPLSGLSPLAHIGRPFGTKSEPVLKHGPNTRYRGLPRKRGKEAAVFGAGRPRRSP